MEFFMELFAGTLAAGYYVAMVVITVLLLVAGWRIFQKAGYPGWASIIPFYNLYVEYKIAWGNGWLFLLTFIPVINIVVAIILQIKLAKAFGYPSAFAIGLIFLPNIFQLIMGFDNSKYIGPQ